MQTERCCQIQLDDNFIYRARARFFVDFAGRHSTFIQVGISTSSQRLEEKTYEGDGYRKGNERLGSRGDAEQRVGYGNGELQRRTGKSRHHAGRRWTKAVVAGQTGPVLGKQTDGNRRTVRRDQGTRCRLLDLAGSVDGRGRRVVEALSESDARRI